MPLTTVYALTNPSFSAVKIGYSQNVNQRLGVMNTSVPERFRVYYSRVMPTTELARCLEKKLHEHFHRYRAPNGEFFNVDPDMIALEMFHMSRELGCPPVKKLD